MKTWLLPAAAWIIAGCSAPQLAAPVSPAGSFASALSAKALAACVARNAASRSTSSAFTSTLRDEGAEPFVLVHAHAAQVRAVIEVRSSAQGAIASLQLGAGAEIEERHSLGGVMEGYVTGCE